MLQRPVVSYRDPSTPDVARPAIPEWMLSVVVFGAGVIVFASIAISYKW
jgi:hypothetical protein